MPKYSMSAPDGNTYQIDGPAGASDEQVRAEILRQHPNAGTAGGGGGGGDVGGSWLGRAAAGLWRGMGKGGLGSDVMHYDPVTKSYTGGTSRQEEAAAPTDRTSRLSELAGEMMMNPSILGGKAVTAGSRLLTETRLGQAVAGAGQRVGRALGIGAGENVPRPFAQSSWQDARAADKALGTLGQRGGVTVLGQKVPGLTSATGRVAQAIEPKSARLPGGGALRRELVTKPAQQAAMSAQEIATNLGTASGKYKGFSEGRALASQTLAGMLTPDAKGAVDAEKFLQQWQAMAPAERDAIFGAKAIGGEFGKSMTKLASNMEKIKQLPPVSLRALIAKIPHAGTKGTILAAGAAGGAIANIGAIIHALLNWKFMLAAGGIAALTGTSNKLLAEGLTNPSTVAWLAAQTTRLVAQTKGQQRGTYDEPLSDMQGDLR